jgi:2',3'-cyclic-nucleotide 2'-phosphodiesterase (5'-nucleotidase family)
VVVALTHLGHAADRELAASVPRLDVIVGGHSHTKVLQPALVGTTAVAQAWEHGKALGIIDLTVDGGKVVGIEGRLEEIRPAPDGGDPAVRALVEKQQERVDTVLNEPAGEAAVDLDGEGVRSRETNLGNLVADVLREASGAEAALTNGGGIRATIRKGTVRAKDVYLALPFDGYVVAVRLTGRQLRQSLEHAVSGVERGEGRFPQVSGLRFTWSRSAPAGARVREVWIGEGILDPERSYVVATNDFLAAGGDGFGAFGDAVKASKGFEVVGGALKGEALVFSDPGRWLRDVFVARLRRAGTVSPSVEGRIREVE